jgi:hypothetical protein
MVSFNSSLQMVSLCICLYSTLQNKRGISAYLSGTFRVLHYETRCVMKLGKFNLSLFYIVIIVKEQYNHRYF